MRGTPETSRPLFDYLPVKPDTSLPKPPKAVPIFVIDSCGGLRSVRQITTEMESRFREAQKRKPPVSQGRPVSRSRKQ